MKTKLLSMTLVAAALFALSASANAETITISNPGFEIGKLGDGILDYIQGARDFWRHFDLADNGGPVSLWNPSALPPGSPGFGGNAPEGEMIVRVSTRYNDDRPTIAPHVRDFEACAQLLTASFDPTTPYTLTAKVGNPDGLLWNGYAVQLAAGGENIAHSGAYSLEVAGGTVIAEDYNSLTVPEGKFVTSTVTYTPDPAYADLAGLPLQIRLCALEDPEDHSNTSYAAFDDVKLSCGPLNAGDDMVTWSGEPVQLAPTTGGYTPSTYAWSANPAGGVVFDPNEFVEAPTVTITKPALALTEVSIVNPGFEAPVLADGGWTNTPPAWTNGYYAVAAPMVWVVGDSLAGAYNPAAGADYNGVAPEGNNLMYATSGAGYDKGMNQVLSATLQANTQYDLSVKVGNPSLWNFEQNGSTTTADYRIELLAGGVVLASDTGPSPLDDTTSFITASLTYNSGASPAQLGMALTIRLLAVNFTDGYGVDFDDVKLTAEGPTPDPYTVTLKFVVDGDVHEDTMTIDVYDTGCLAARIGEGKAADNPGDFNGNCITDSNDLAELATTWLDDNSLTAPVPK